MIANPEAPASESTMGQTIPESGQGEDIAAMIEILQRLAVGFKIVIDENTWLRRRAILSHQVKFEPQVSECAKGFEKD
jgi:hypothetical protein